MGHCNLCNLNLSCFIAHIIIQTFWSFVHYSHILTLFRCSIFFWLGKDFAWNNIIPSMWVIFAIPTLLMSVDFVYVTFWHDVSTSGPRSLFFSIVLGVPSHPCFTFLHYHWFLVSTRRNCSGWLSIIFIHRTLYSNCSLPHSLCSFCSTSDHVLDTPELLFVCTTVDISLYSWRFLFNLSSLFLHFLFTLSPLSLHSLYSLSCCPLYQSDSRVSDLAHYSSQLLWVSANIVWAAGEIWDPSNDYPYGLFDMYVHTHVCSHTHACYVM